MIISALKKKNIQSEDIENVDFVYRQRSEEVDAEVAKIV